MMRNESIFFSFHFVYGGVRNDSIWNGKPMLKIRSGYKTTDNKTANLQTAKSQNSEKQNGEQQNSE